MSSHQRRWTLFISLWIILVALYQQSKLFLSYNDAMRLVPKLFDQDDENVENYLRAARSRVASILNNKLEPAPTCSFELYSQKCRKKEFVCWNLSIADEINANTTDSGNGRTYVHVPGTPLLKKYIEIGSSTRVLDYPVLPPPRPRNRKGEAFNPCRTLWFTGFHEGEKSKCSDDGGGYRQDFSVALTSANLFAQDSLQPVLMLGQYGQHNDNNTDTMTINHNESALVQWAQSMGAIIVPWDRLTFQHVVNEGLPAHFSSESLQAPFLRLDIPTMIERHRLFDRPGICPRHVLYTDADAMFVNRITLSEIDELKRRYLPENRSTILSFGRESWTTHTEPANTGVMLMDVPRFKQEWPKILQVGNRCKPVSLHAS